MAAHNDFFTWQSLTTFAGTTMATTAIVNGICSALPGFRHPAALGLSVSIVLCLLFAMVDPSTGEIVLARPFATYLIALVNGFFVFTSAAGISAGGARAAGGPARGAGRTRGSAAPSGGPAPAPGPAPRRFWRDWL